MWVRGLKLATSVLAAVKPHVASYVGAWIETVWFWHAENAVRSHPMWVRGLKHRFKNHIHVLRICVAPHVDAWIQTYV